MLKFGYWIKHFDILFVFIITMVLYRGIKV